MLAGRANLYGSGNSLSANSFPVAGPGRKKLSGSGLRFRMGTRCGKVRKRLATLLNLTGIPHHDGLKRARLPVPNPTG